MKWISCKDKLPEKAGLYLVTVDGDICGDDNFVDADEYFCDDECVGWGYDLSNSTTGPYILAWAELPEPSEHKEV